MARRTIPSQNLIFDRIIGKSDQRGKPLPKSGDCMHPLDSIDPDLSNTHGEETVIARMGNDGCLEP